MRTPILAAVILALPLAAACIDEPFEPSEPTTRDALGELPTLTDVYHVDPIRDPAAAELPPLDVDDIGPVAPWSHEDPPFAEPRGAYADEPVLDAVDVGRRARARYDALAAARLVR